MKFAYSTSIFRLRALSEAIEGIARAGICAVELIAERPHAFPEDMTATQISALSLDIEQRKMKVVNLNACGVTTPGEVNSPSWIEENWQPRETRIRYVLDCMRMAAAMGVPHVTTGGAGVLPSTMNQQDGVRLFVANLQRVLPLAAKLGVKLLVQPEPGMLIETSDQVMHLFNEVDFNEALGIDFDPVHFYCTGEDPCEAWKKLKKYILHVHLEDVAEDRNHRHIQLGEGAMDIPQFLGCVRESGYDGYVTVKLDAYEQRPEEAVLASAEYLRAKGFLPENVEPCA
jgi:sugar phosphate isomerase/epimerase